MTDPQLPPSSPHGSVPPVPMAPVPHPPVAGAYVAPSSQAPDRDSGAPTAVEYPVPPGAYPAPIGGYPAPVGGYPAPAAGYAPTGGYQPPVASQPKSPVLGIVAFALSIIATAVASIIGGSAGYQIGFRLPTVTQQVDATTSDLSFLAPVRDQVLMGEISFWLGTLAGIAAIVLAIMAIVKRAGRAWGITALVLGIIGPVIFFTVLGVTLGIGAGAGSTAFGA